MNWFGEIVLGEIKNISPVIESRDAVNANNFSPLTESSIRFVHYPDCQQLIIWLPRPGVEYKGLRLIDNKSDKVQEIWQVADKLNGSIQLLWDTLPVKPGNYTLELEGINGGRHLVSFTKYREGEKPVIQQTFEPINISNEDRPTNPIIYKDSRGRIIPDEDLALREELNKEIPGKFFRHLEYEGNFRAGTIIYVDGNTRIRFSHEMGGGNCMFYIDIPTEQSWEHETNTTRGKRKDILEFVATKVQEEQASHCNYEIKDNSIVFYYK